jgi:hypothetical protein
MKMGAFLRYNVLKAKGMAKDYWKWAGVGCFYGFNHIASN